MTVHIWRIDLARLNLPELWTLLAPDERARAERFHFARDRDRFVGARGALRVLLAAHGGSRPELLRFSYGPQGKPALDDEASALRFNLAHSDNLALIAITRGGDVGVDLERVPPLEVVAEVGPRVFCGRERERLDLLEGDARRWAFTRFWTRKEAYIKADGAGFSLPLERIDVSGRSRRALILDESARAWTASPLWSLHPVRVPAGYAAAVAVARQPARLILRSWNGRQPPGAPSGPPADPGQPFGGGL